MNLPHAIQYRQENVILVGLMPGPHVPKHNINSFIEPMVTELLELWEGVEMNIVGNIGFLIDTWPRRTKASRMRAERLYGKQFITPNMHLHMHLKSCILDYGPLHGFMHSNDIMECLEAFLITIDLLKFS